MQNQTFERNRQDDVWQKASQIRDKFEFDRERRMREKGWYIYLIYIVKMFYIHLNNVILLCSDVFGNQNARRMLRLKPKVLDFANRNRFFTAKHGHS